MRIRPQFPGKKTVFFLQQLADARTGGSRWSFGVVINARPVVGGDQGILRLRSSVQFMDSTTAVWLTHKGGLSALGQAAFPASGAGLTCATPTAITAHCRSRPRGSNIGLIGTWRLRQGNEFDSWRRHSGGYYNRMSVTTDTAFELDGRRFAAGARPQGQGDPGRRRQLLDAKAVQQFGQGACAGVDIVPWVSTEVEYSRQTKEDMFGIAQGQRRPQTPENTSPIARVRVTRRGDLRSKTSHHQYMTISAKRSSQWRTAMIPFFRARRRRRA